MHAKPIQIAAIFLALVSAPVTTAATASQPPDEQPLTPCESAAVAIAEHATKYTEQASATNDPFERTDRAAKSCGVLLRGIKELNEMRCPQEIVNYVIEAQKEARETLDQLNELHEYRFSCFVPDFL